MHPALRKGPLFTKHPPFSTFFTKTTPRFPLFLTKTPPFHFLPPGLVVLDKGPLNGRVCVRACVCVCVCYILTFFSPLTSFIAKKNICTDAKALLH